MVEPGELLLEGVEEHQGSYHQRVLLPSVPFRVAPVSFPERQALQVCCRSPLNRHRPHHRHSIHSQMSWLEQLRMKKWLVVLVQKRPESV